MRVGVLGSGDVGKVLASGFAARGHEVMMGSRDPNRKDVVAWAEDAGERALTGTPEATALFGDLLVLATDWNGTKSAIDLAQPRNFAGKVVIDVTNPLHYTEGAPPALVLGHTDSGGEQVQRWLPEARVVKAFNMVGNAHMVDPKFPGGPPDMFICGNDRDAKQTVKDILESFGWGAIDLGGIEGSRYIEPLAMAWILHGFATGEWDHAFKMLHK